jgi:MarR family transcriptional regulator, transcriptional regulator for hemolysin
MKDQSQDSLGFLLHDAARLLRRRFEMRAGELGLSSAQWRLLFNLKRMGQTTQARLAERLEIEPISVSRMIDRMADAGWVTREADPADRRNKIILPTQKSRRTFEDIRSVANEVYDEALAGFAPEECAALRQALTRMISNLSETLPTEVYDDH